MADEQQFIEDGLQRTQIDEFFADELGRAGYGGMEVAKTPMGTQIVLKAEKPGMVIGKGGKNIRKITDTLETEFELDDPQVDVQEVDEPDLNARIVADRLANALERGWYFRKAGHTTIDRIMEAGALGAEIVLSGKVTGARSRVEKFNRGYIKHNGEPAEEIVDHGVATAVMKLGTIGVQVKIIPPDAELPDDFEIYEDVDVSEFVEEAEGVEELLAGEPDEADEQAAAIGAPPESEDGAEAATEPATNEEPDEEVLEEEVVDEEFAEPDVPDESGVEEELDDLAADVEEELDEDTEAEAEELMEEMDEADAESAESEETEADGDDKEGDEE
ncbi:30S ribosomal protein S3 [Halobacteriales archaeon SW_10_68_16]|nr:MAG: 30S ribosomal protein S3 [Halobacteriales archaeon SW_10_68_16]